MTTTDAEESRLGIVVVLGCALAVGVLSLVVSRRGLLTTSDSALYLGTARNLLDGHGLTSPITLLFTDAFTPLETLRHHGELPLTTLPPGYGILLAAFGVFGIGLDWAARLAGALSIAVAIGLLGIMALRLTRSWVVAAGVLVVTVVAGPLYGGFVPGSWLLLSASVLSEAPYLALSFAALLLLARFLDRGRTVDLVATGVVVGVALLSRYFAVALVATGALLILARWSWPLAARLRRVVAFGALSAGPVLLWVAWTRLFVGSGKPSTPVRLHPVGSLRFSEGLTNLERWLVPTSVPKPVALAVLLLVIAVVGGIAATRPWRRPPTAAAHDDGEPRAATDPLWACVALYVLMYGAAMFATHVIVNEGVAFDARFIAPVRPLVYLLGAATLFWFLVRFSERLAAVSVGALCLLVALPFGGVFTGLVTDGALPNGRAHSAMAAAVKRLPPSAVVLSNAPDQLWLDAGRRSIIVPVVHVPESGLDNERYEADLRQTAEILRRPDSYLAMYGGYYQTAGLLATTADIERLVPLQVVGRYPEGELLRRDPTRPAAPSPP